MPTVRTQRPGSPLPRAFARASAPARAFSLVELVIVVVIVSLIAGIAAPRYFSGQARYRVRAAAERLAGDLAGARARAQDSSATTRVEWTPGTGAYSVRSRVGAADRLEVVDLAAEPYRATITHSNLSGVVTFDGFGRPGAAGSIVVRVGDLWCEVSIDDAGEARAMEPTTTRPILLIMGGPG